MTPLQAHSVGQLNKDWRKVLLLNRKIRSILQAVA
jgi:hypothetical protein